MNPEFRKLFGSKGGGGATEFSCGVKAASHGEVPAVAAGAVVQLIVPITTPVPGSLQSVVTANVHVTGGLGIGGPAGRNRAGGREKSVGTNPAGSSPNVTVCGSVGSKFVQSTDSPAWIRI